ncbi:MAG: hypothetical protein ACT4O0_11635 [Pseudonocardia sp.]
MRITAHQRDGQTVVVPSGSLDVRTYPVLCDVMMRHIADGPSALIVDLDQLQVTPDGPISVEFRVPDQGTASRRRAELDVPASTISAAQARRWITAVLASWDLAGAPCGSGAVPPDTLAEDAVLIGSELVENLIRHARTEGRLRLELRPYGLLIAAQDGNPEPPKQGPLHVLARGGRGLAVIDQLAIVWGHDPRWCGGKVVWAVLDLPAPY